MLTNEFSRSYCTLLDGILNVWHLFLWFLEHLKVKVDPLKNLLIYKHLKCLIVDPQFTLRCQINVPLRLSFLEIPRTLLGPRLLIFANFNLSNCKIFKHILSLKKIFLLISACKTNILVANEWIGPGVWIYSMNLYFHL